jgi:hypothetical protein
LQLQQKPKNPLITCTSLHYSFSLPSSIIVILFHFTNTEALCLATTRWSWGHKTKKLALQVVRQGLKKLRLYFPKFDIKSRVTLVDKILLLQHSALGVPINWHTCLVSSMCHPLMFFGSSMPSYMQKHTKRDTCLVRTCPGVAQG